MLYKVERLLIPEHIILITMGTKEFNKYVRKELVKNPTIYQYEGQRYIFHDGDFAIQEQLE